MYIPPGGNVKFVDLTPAMNVMQSVYYAIMDLIIFPNMMHPSDKPLSPFKQAYCYTVEVNEANDNSMLAKPTVDTALPSLLDCKQASALDHDVKLYLLALTDSSSQFKSPAFFTQGKRHFLWKSP
jgi:hypothetical protein